MVTPSGVAIDLGSAIVAAIKILDVNHQFLLRAFQFGRHKTPRAAALIQCIGQLIAHGQIQRLCPQMLFGKMQGVRIGLVEQGIAFKRLCQHHFQHHTGLLIAGQAVGCIWQAVVFGGWRTGTGA